MIGPPLNGRELAAALGIHEDTLSRRVRLGKYRHLEVAKPEGQRKYSQQLVHDYLGGKVQAPRLVKRRAS